MSVVKFSLFQGFFNIKRKSGPYCYENGWWQSPLLPTPFYLYGLQFPSSERFQWVFLFLLIILLCLFDIDNFILVFL